jgi:hypothetical protein
LKVSDTRDLRSVIRCAVAVTASAAGLCAHASPSDFVFDPYADEGTRVVQYAYGAERERDGTSEQAQTLALAWSPTARWFTAAYAGWYREPGESLSFYSLSWVNHLTLTPASSPFSVGAYLEVERPQDRSEGDGLTWGPTFQFDLDHAQLNLNLWLEKDVHAQDADPTSLNYQWQVKSLWRPHLEWGAQGFGTMGPWRHWAPSSEQEHTLGPALFAKCPLQGGEVLRLDAAVLIGLTSGSPRGTFRVRTQYQF